MAVDALRCRVCETEYPADRERDVRALLRAARAGLRLGCRSRERCRREQIEAGPRSLWRYEALLPTSAPADAAGGPGWTPLVARAAARERARRRRALAEARPRQPDALLQGPSRRRRRGEGARARQRHARVRVDRQSRQRGRRACRRERHAVGRPLPATVEPEKLVATAVYGAEMYAVRGSYDDCSRLVVELAGEVDWAFVNVNLRAYYAEGSKTLAFEIAEQLGWEAPDAVVAPVASGSLLTKLWQGFEQFGRLGLVDGRQPAYLRRPGRRVRAGRARVRRGAARSRPCARRRSRTRSRSARRPTATSRSRPRATSGGAIYAVPEDDVGANMSLLAETSGVFGETAAGVTIGALREAALRGGLGAGDRVVAARHRHRAEDAAARRDGARGHRDRRRRRRAARGAGGERMTDVTTETVSSTDCVRRSPALDGALVATVNARRRDGEEDARYKEEHGIAVPRPRTRGVAARAT